ncbi:MAG: hypothetical protein NVS4B5_15570 [Vulcanimicrobiaceae bacterium]
MDEERGLLDVGSDRADRPSACPFAGAASLPEGFEAIVDSALEPFVSLDTDGRVIAWNAQAAETFGWSAAEAIGAAAADLIVPPELRERHRLGMLRYRHTAKSNVVGKRVRMSALHKNGRRLSVELRVGLALRDDGSRLYHAFIRDVTAFDRARAEIEMQNALLSEAQRVAHLGSYDHDVESGVVRCSDELLEILGLRRETFVGSIVELIARFHPDDRDLACDRYAAALRLGTAYDFEHRIVRVDGSVRTIRRVGYVSSGAHGRAIRSFATVQDVSDQRRVEALQREDRSALDAVHERLRRSLEDAPIGMALAGVDLAARELLSFREVNGALCRLTGFARETLLGLGLADLLDPGDLPGVALAIEQLVSDVTPLVALHARYMHVDRAPRWWLLHVSLVRPAEDVSEPYAIVQIVDITNAKRAEKRLEYLAHHDPLTELLNRRGLEAMVRDRSGDSAACQTSSALLLIDLDYFKYVNDTRGHAIGDRLLQSVALTLERSTGPTDWVARLGGDEFIVVLSGVDATTALSRADAIRTAISTEIERYSRSGLHVSASVGVAVLQDGFVDGIEEALAAADTALAEAKERGRNRTHLFAASVGGRETMRERLDWAQRIRSALRTGGFQLFRQPILELATGRIDRYELLVRMVDLDGNAVDPAAFLREAERFGMMVDIDTWVVNEAIRICAEDERAGRFVVYEVNLSGASLSHDGTADAIELELRRTGIDPKRLVFEVTETTAISNMVRASDLATALCALGCEFALDDFGAGFSSFYYLKHLPFQYLKLDGEFIAHLPDDERDQHIVRAIVALARGLGKKTIAEFVTDARTAALLVEYGVDFAQGHFVGKAVPFDPSALAAIPPLQDERPESVEMRGPR